MLQLFLGNKTFPVASDCPNGTIYESPVKLSQSFCTIRLGSYGNPGRFCFGVGFRGMATQLRKGILAKEPAVVLSGEVECDEVYIVAGHNGNPEAVKKKEGRGVEGV